MYQRESRGQPERGEEDMSDGRITISRYMNSDQIAVELTDDLSRVRFVTAQMSLEAFARALTGQGEVPCGLEIRGLQFVGMKAENKTEIVSCERPYGDKKKLKAAVAALRKFEVDGWRADPKDLENGHNYGPNGITVRFSRHVAARQPL